MEKPSRHLYRNLFWLLVCSVTLFRLFFAGTIGLGVDESHYVLYSRHLAWGYFDHPPMVGFLAALTSLWGEGPVFFRLGPIISAAIGLILLRMLALQIYEDERVAFWAATLILLMPYQHLLTVALLPDATLNLFWSASLLASWKAMREGKWWVWGLAGVSFGGALLSKYHAVLLPVCLFLYMLASSRDRPWLARPQPYLALLIGLTIFLPNILWNAQHGWVSYRYQLTHGAGGELRIGKVLEVLGGQMLAWSPGIFVLLIASLVVLLREKPVNESDRFVFWTSFPVFAFFYVTGSFGKMLPHWPSVGWWTGSLAITMVTLRKISQNGKSALRWRRWSFLSGVAGLLMVVSLYVVLFVPIVGPLYSRARSLSLKLNKRVPAVKPLGPFKSEYDLTNELFGWKQVAEQVERIKAEMPHPEKTFVFGHRFWTTSQVAVYLHPETVATTLYHRFNQYRLWFSPKDYTGWDALFLDDNRYFKGSKRYLPLFESVDPDPVRIVILRKGKVAHEIRVYRYYGFKGKFEGE